MNRSCLALCAAVLAYAIHPTTAVAQEEAPTCIYDPATAAFRAYDAASDSALTRETLFERDRPAFIMIDGMRFQLGEPMRGAVDELNGLIQSRGMVDGVRYFGTADAHSDLVAAITQPSPCVLHAYNYAPSVHGAWVEELPFDFRFPALAVDAASFRRDGDRAHGVGFLMRGHPHLEDNPALYYRQTIESDCAAERTRIVDTRAYAAENTLHQRFAEEGNWVANADLNHPATRVLAQLVCNPPPEWPANTRLESLDAFSEQVHAAAH